MSTFWNPGPLNDPNSFGDVVMEISAFAPSPTNPRETFDDEKLAKLADSIKTHGVLQPVLARPWPQGYQAPAGTQPKYELVAGERRWRAAQIAGCKVIPSRIRQLTDNEVLEIQILENLQREDLHPIEEATGYERMIHDYGYSAESLAEKIGKSKAYVYGRMKLTALCHDARKAFCEGKLTPSTALLIARIPTEKLQVKACKEITDGNWHGEPMSFRRAKDHIQDRYMLRLVEAPFDTDDADLLKKIGSCKACPKRTGNQPKELFEDVESTDVCTDPDCHQQKRQAHMARVAKEAEATGKKVITGKAAEQLMPYSGSVKGHVRLDEKCYDAPAKKGEYPTYRQLLKDQAVETVMVEDKNKHVLVEVAPEKQIAKALKDAGIKVSQSSSGRDAEAEKKAKAERAYREALLRATREQLQTDFTTCATLGDDDMRLIALRMYGRLDFDTSKSVIKYYIEGKVEHAQVYAFPDTIKVMTAPDLALLLMTMALINDTAFHAYSSDNKPEALLAVAKSCDIDPAKVRKQLENDGKAKQTPAKVAPKAKKEAKTAEKSTPETIGEALPPTQAAQAEETMRDEGTEWPRIGDRVRIKNTIQGTAAWKRAVCGKEGVVEATDGGYFSVRIAEGKKGLVEKLVWNEVDAVPAPTQAARADEGSGIEKNETIVVPRSAWPFPSGVPKSKAVVIESNATPSPGGDDAATASATTTPAPGSIEKNAKPKRSRSAEVAA